MVPAARAALGARPRHPLRCFLGQPGSSARPSDARHMHAGFLARIKRRPDRTASVCADLTTPKRPPHEAALRRIGINERSAYWCGANRRRRPARAASRRSSPRAAVADQARPRVGPARMQNSGPTGSWIRCSAQRPTCSHAQSSIPTIRRFPPLPARTSTDPVFGSRSVSVRASASLIRNPARHRIAISPRVLSAYWPGRASRITRMISSTVGGSAG